MPGPSDSGDGGGGTLGAGDGDGDGGAPLGGAENGGPPGSTGGAGGGTQEGGAGASGQGGSAGAPFVGPLPDPEPPPPLSAGEFHTCGVSEAETLFCWGTNTSLALGGFVGTESALPVPVTGEGALGGFEGVTAGRNASCALRGDGSVWCWGENDYGQLGQGDTSDRASPVEVPLPLPARTVSLNYGVSCAIDEVGALYCWGWNFEGQMGQSDDPASPVDSTRPILIPSDVPWAEVSTGDGHVCAIRADGALYCWGRNSSGELGRDAPIQIRTPVQVGRDDDWRLVSASQSQTCAIKEDQSLWCWGAGTSGQLGIDPAIDRKAPTRVGNENDWLRVEPQALHTCALRTDGSLWCWGRREEGQLTLGYDPNPVVTPTLIDPNLDWEGLSAGRFHTCGKRAGIFSCSGENVDGRLGTGTLTRSYGFLPVASF